jgi:formyltetrahydrofolate synthetase
MRIQEVFKGLWLMEDEYEISGRYRGKIDLKVLKRLENAPLGNYVLVSGINPTALGEGKSTTTIGLAQSLGAHLGKNAFAAVRVPSTGPLWGTKGGAAGGGYSQILPMEDFNLSLTDIVAVAAANNLMAAAIDSRMFHESTQTDDQLLKRLCPDGFVCDIMKKRVAKLGIPLDAPVSTWTPEQVRKFARLDIDPSTLTVQRVVDINDRHLRRIKIGLGPQEKGHTRETGFDLAVASEVMGVLTLATSFQDLRERLGRIVVGFNKDNEPVTAEDVGVAGAMAVLMREAIMPNVMQTAEGTPVLVHAGPFANIAPGQNSILADQVGLRLVGPEGFVVTEAGFGADIGMEKFVNIKCRYSGLRPNCVVIVATVRALKNHGGVEVSQCKKENVEAVRIGCANLRRHIENACNFGVPVVVCINKFTTDTQAEIDAIIEESLAAGARAAVPSNHWAEGGKGAIPLAEAVIRVCKENREPQLQFTYPLNSSIKEKIETICKTIYRADGVDYTEEAEKRIVAFEKNGFDSLPICMAKTAMSFTSDPNLRNAPTGFRITVRDIRASVGAGYLYPLLGEISTMPGFTTRPAYYDVDIDAEGKVVGLF